MKITVFLRFYAELNDFLEFAQHQKTLTKVVQEKTAIKDIIESCGIPHTEVDLILANGVSVNFSYQPQQNDLISVYPTFELFDVHPVSRLRPQPLRITRFLLDVHLGKLAKYLRLLGLDTAYHRSCDDKNLINLSLEEQRIMLTRDIGLLKNKKVTHGYWLRHTDPLQQTQEVVQYFHLKQQFKPFSRCLLCNHGLAAVEKNSIIHELKPMTAQIFSEFKQCTFCKKIYWQGSHYQKLLNLISLFANNDSNSSCDH